jgi:hypothetical protein
MEKAIAVHEILIDWRSRRGRSTAGAKRVLAACNALGMDDKNRLRVFELLEYCDADGKAYGAVKPVWLPKVAP